MALMTEQNHTKPFYKQPKTKSHSTLKPVSKFLLMYLGLLILCPLKSKNQIQKKMEYVSKLIFLSPQLFYCSCIFLNSQNTKDVNFYIECIFEYIINSSNDTPK